MKRQPSGPARQRLRDFCERWHIRELSVFGSVVRGDLTADSHSDSLVSFESDQPVSLLNLLEMEMKLPCAGGRSNSLRDRL